MRIVPTIQDALTAEDVYNLMHEYRAPNAGPQPTYNVVVVIKGSGTQTTLPVCSGIENIEAARYLRDLLNGQLLASEQDARFYVEEVGLTPVTRVA